MPKEMLAYCETDWGLTRIEYDFLQRRAARDAARMRRAQYLNRIRVENAASRVARSRARPAIVGFDTPSGFRAYTAAPGITLPLLSIQARSCER